jgi:hypothetical protein
MAHDLAALVVFKIIFKQQSNSPARRQFDSARTMASPLIAVQRAKRHSLRTFCALAALRRRTAQPVSGQLRGIARRLIKVLADRPSSGD